MAPPWCQLVQLVGPGPLATSAATKQSIRGTYSYQTLWPLSLSNSRIYLIYHIYASSSQWFENPGYLNCRNKNQTIRHLMYVLRPWNLIPGLRMDEWCPSTLYHFAKHCSASISLASFCLFGRSGLFECLLHCRLNLYNTVLRCCFGFGTPTWLQFLILLGGTLWLGFGASQESFHFLAVWHPNGIPLQLHENCMSNLLVNLLAVGSKDLRDAPEWSQSTAWGSSLLYRFQSLLPKSRLENAKHSSSWCVPHVFWISEWIEIQLSRSFNQWLCSLSCYYTAKR